MTPEWTNVSRTARRPTDDLVVGCVEGARLRPQALESGDVALQSSDALLLLFFE
jgi:hypothetical protein